MTWFGRMIKKDKLTSANTAGEMPADQQDTSGGPGNWQDNGAQVAGAKNKPPGTSKYNAASETAVAISHAPFQTTKGDSRDYQGQYSTAGDSAPPAHLRDKNKSHSGQGGSATNGSGLNEPEPPETPDTGGMDEG